MPNNGMHPTANWQVFYARLGRSAVEYAGVMPGVRLARPGWRGFDGLAETAGKGSLIELDP